MARQVLLHGAIMGVSPCVAAQDAGAALSADALELQVQDSSGAIQPARSFSATGAPPGRLK